MGKIKTYLDSSVIIQVFRITQSAKALLAAFVLQDPLRKFVVSDYVELETIPKMRFNLRLEQVEFVNKLFEKAIFIRSSKKIVSLAQNLASEYGLAGMDALHAASAIIGGADELITFEKPTKPFFNIPSNLLKVVSLYG